MDTYRDIEKQEQTTNSIRHTMPVHANPNSQTIFSWRNISYSVETPVGEKQILTNVDGSVEKGYFSSLTFHFLVFPSRLPKYRC